MVCSITPSSRRLEVVANPTHLSSGGNEWWEETERRQGKCVNRNIHYVGTGVSGGYQSSRHGPSISPSGTPEAYAKVEAKLKKWAAKDGKGNPCVCYVGPGGSGHYVKVSLGVLTFQMFTTIDIADSFSR